MNNSLQSSPGQARQIKHKFSNSEEYLSYELGQAVKELPPLYTRLVAGTITMLIFGTISWAALSKVDEVAVAPGQLVPAEPLRPVRSVSEGIIVRVFVKAGDRVKQGQPLIERDQDISKTEIDSLLESSKLISQDITRLEAEIKGTTNTGTPLQDQLLAARLSDFQFQFDAAQAEAQKQLATVQEAQTRLSGYQENLANAQTNHVNAQTLLQQAQASLTKAKQKEEALRILVNPENRAFPRLEYIEAQNKVIQAEASVTKAQKDLVDSQDSIASLKKEITAQQQKITQAQQAYQAAQKKAQGLQSERDSEILSRLNERREELTNLEGKLAQAKQKQNLEIITAPITGTVYEVKASLGPVQRSEELLSILPETQEVLLEVKVLNKDIGFVDPGDQVKVKITTFPFQEYGTIDGEVINISPNSIVDEDLGLVFPTIIKLKQTWVTIGDKKIPLTPGMSATGEIVSRQKTILAFMLEPITRRVNEAFSVR